MQILMITRHFPPDRCAESFCAGKVAKALADLGADVTVVTRRSPRHVEHGDKSFWWKELGVRICRVLSHDTRNWPRHPRELRGFWSLSSALSNWWGVRAHTLCMRLLRKERFDIIFTRTLPLSAILIGAQLRKRFHVPWVASITDPPIFFLCPPPYADGRANSFSDRREFRWLRHALQLADAFVFPHMRLCRYVSRVAGVELQHKTTVVPHIGWKIDNVNAERKTCDFKILHSGSIMHRLSHRFLTAFSEILRQDARIGNSVRLHFQGSSDANLESSLQRAELGNFFLVEQRVHYEESLRSIDNASALLLMEAQLSEGIFLPSKLADYAVSGKPVLLCCPELGVVSDLVGGYQHPGFLGQGDQVATRLKRFLAKAVVENADLSDYAFPNPQQFSPEEVGRQLLDLFTSLSDNS